MSRPLIVDACVLIDYAESGIEVLSLASQHIGTVHVAAPVLSEAREHASRERCAKLP